MSGCTDDLKKRVYVHKKRLISGFTKLHNVDRLVQFEMTGGIKAALAREKQINEYRRENKNQLVDRMNPEWIDLYGRLEFER